MGGKFTWGKQPAERRTLQAGKVWELTKPYNLAGPMTITFTRGKKTYNPVKKCKKKCKKL